MAISMFLQVSGITGESKDSNHTGWSDILSFSWGANQPNNMNVGGGGGAGKVYFNDLHVNALIDKATPSLMKYCANGEHIPTITLSVCKAGGTQVEYTQIVLTQVLVTAVQYIGAHTDDTVGINYSFQAASVKSEYWVQLDTGGQGASTEFTWDIKQNTGS
ncbi:type VI secretion system tube protein Hcp [Serratia sp. M24T3]|uniref:Hcp family type VI secretion system effector n=1 Tax=Rouxiella sp. WC2420 TaxID=3234145 RepID=A0AB39VU98_9GAMM|nr:type VI secretion system tube protein Hcp [Serratia sp. M24T3]EIC84123.1 hypothetical protein SPM24T3_13396 [Serratia sp. M24T3]